MIIFRYLLSVALVLGNLCLLPGNASAAQSYDNCVGFINSLPATLSTQGTWCLNKDLATSMASGNAINISANNVTIDCNDFKIGGLAAGAASNVSGIHALDRQNVTVRHCNVRGFYYGIHLQGGAGHLVQDNRLDNNLYTGIRVSGENNRVRRNAIYDTGGAPGNTASYGIHASADVADNTVAGVFAIGTSTYPRGIFINGSNSEIRGNQVRGLVVTGSGFAAGIYADGAGSRFVDNHISAMAATAVGGGIYSFGANTFCIGNTVVNFAAAYNGCTASVHNLFLP